MGMLKLVLMRALSLSSSTRIGEVGLGEVMRVNPRSTGFVSLVDFCLSEISEVFSPFGM